MQKYIHNKTEETKIYAGNEVLAGATMLITSEKSYIFKDDSYLINDLAIGLAGISRDGINEISNINDALDLLKDIPSNILKTDPFSSKTTNGKKLFRRKHGKGASVDASSMNTISIIIPYNNCKINMIEIMGCKLGDTVNLKVYDTEQGLISTVPNYMLNQFGISVQMPDGYYKDESRYDADLIAGMKVELEYYNNESQAKYVGVNFTLHEVIS